MDDRIAKDSSRGGDTLRVPAVAGEQKRLCGLLRRRSCWLPTWRAWLSLLAALLFVSVLVVRFLHPFLAVNDPIPDGLLVVEGWTPDYGMAIAAKEFARDQYHKLYVTGGPIEYGSFLVGYKTYAELGAATLVKLGLDSNVVQAVPAPQVRQDRTYNSAVALKKWLLAHDIKPQRIHLVSDGPHCRRSRLLFQKAMGNDVVIGITSIPPKDYDAAHWWRYSAGVRVVIGEGLAYLYARFLFSPPNGS